MEITLNIKSAFLYILHTMIKQKQAISFCYSGQPKLKQSTGFQQNLLHFLS